MLGSLRFEVLPKFVLERISGSSHFSFLDSSLNTMVVFNIEVTTAARFALKTTSAFKEKPKKEKLEGRSERE